MTDIEKELEHINLYDILRLTRGESDPVLIKQGFSDLIKIFHSDKGGHSNLHKFIVFAYKILSDPVSKYFYDEFGVYAQIFNPNSFQYKILKQIILKEKLSENDRNLIRNYITKNIQKKIKPKEENNEYIPENHISNTYLVSPFDYLMDKYLLETEKQTKYILTKLKQHNLLIRNDMCLYKKDHHIVRLSTYHKNIPLSHSFEEEYILSNIMNVRFPFGSLFQMTHFGNENHLIITREDDLNIHWEPAIILYNFLYSRNLSFYINPMVDLKNMKTNSFKAGLKFETGRHKGNIRIDRSKGSLLFTDSIRLNERNKLYLSLNMSRDSTILTGQYYERFSKHYGKAYGITLMQNGFSITNAFIYKKNDFGWEIKSTFTNLRGTDPGISNNSILSFEVSFKNFKIEVPFIYSNKLNVVTSLLLGIASFVGIGLMNLISFSKKIRKNKMNDFFNRFSRIFYLDFISEKRQEYVDVCNREGVDGLIIMSAFYGETTKIKIVYTHLMKIGLYNNNDPKVFDLTIPLTLLIYQSRLEITNDLLGLDGIYCPDISSQKNLSLCIEYRYNGERHVKFLQKTNEIMIP